MGIVKLRYGHVLRNKILVLGLSLGLRSSPGRNAGLGFSL